MYWDEQISCKYDARILKDEQHIIMKQHELDLRTLLCPVPLIRAQSKIKQCQTGDILKIIATDPNVKQDISSWCRIHGHALLDMRELNHEIMITVKVHKQ